jgi:acetyl esterase/lipase
MTRGLIGTSLLAAQLAFLALVAAGYPASAEDVAAPAAVIPLWEQAPTDTPWPGPEKVGESVAPTGSRIAIRSEVVEPTLTVVRPAPGTANGTGVVVAPGGAFMALAWDLEGTEVADWLAERGITAFILKYRVGPPKMLPGQAMPGDIAGLVRLLEPNRQLAIRDGSQAIRLIRRRAAEFAVRPDRIGMMGFSAGAMTTLGVTLEGGADARPDFIAPIYGMIPADAVVPADAPPAFVAVAADDQTVPGAGSIDIFRKWSEAKRPAELHVYEKGNHGFGMRPQGLPVDHWPAAFEAWLTAHGFIPAAASTR